MTSIRVAGRDIALQYDLAAMERIEDTFGSTREALEQWRKARIRALVDGILILHQSAAEDGGYEPVDRAWLTHRLKPGQLQSAMDVLGKAIEEGMAMETEAEDDDAEVDVVLEELKKK